MPNAQAQCSIIIDASRSNVPLIKNEMKKKKKKRGRTLGQVGCFAKQDRAN
jgi:hypothetical protein